MKQRDNTSSQLPHERGQHVDVMARRVLPLDAFMATSTPSGARCRICGKSLTDPESIKRGIGPTCAQKIGLLQELYRKGTTAREAAQKLDVPLEMLPTFLATLGGIPCQYCDVLCHDKNALNEHCREVHDRPHPCPEETCNYAFYWSNNARSHFKRKHSDEKPHECPHEGCDYATANAGDLQSYVRHVHSEERPFECPAQCGYRAKDHSKIIRHLQRKACWYQSSIPKMWEVYCYRVASILFGKNMEWKPKIDVSSITDSQKSIQPEIVIYNKDGKIAKIIDAKTSLYALSHKDVNIYPLVSEQTEFWVLHCNVLDAFGERWEEQGNIIIKSIEDLLDNLNQSFRQKKTAENRQEIKLLVKDLKEFVKALEIGDTSFNCPNCWRKDFNNIDELKEHVDQCDGILICQDCGKDDFSDVYHYYDHVKACGGKLTCPECGRNDFNFKNTYDDHVAACGGKLTCPECGRNDFTSKRYFTGHVKACGGKLTCPECGRNDFSSDINYKKHVKKCRE